MSQKRINKEVITKSIGAYVDPKVTLQERTGIYLDLLGFLPPRVEARMHITGALDPEILDLQERMRTHAMYPKCFDDKTVQLMLFAILLMDLSDATLMHGIAARRAGASWEELQAVVNLVFLFRGISAANRGAEFLATIAEREAENGN
jgi:alkylhydroperoxidase/carboxymuconolactone decarboxylase family protein YurZ